jgi:transcriptional regulator GlxA family with amidase domain
MFPRIELQPDVLYVHNGDTVTSAGSAAGLDLGLHSSDVTTALRSPTKSHAAWSCFRTVTEDRRSS